MKLRGARRRAIWWQYRIQRFVDQSPEAERQVELFAVALDRHDTSPVIRMTDYVSTDGINI